MSFKLLSALAKSHWAISEDYAISQFPIYQGILNRTHDFKAEDLPDDDFVDPEESIDEEDTTQSDAFTGKIVVMGIRGPLMHYGGMCSYGAIDYAQRLRMYADDDSISAGLLDLDCPGGQVTGTETLAAAVAYFASKKTLIGFCEDGVIASAAVWFSSYCTEIYCGNTICRVGSVGVMATLIDFRKAMELQGIKELIIRSPQSKDKNKEYTDALDGKTAALEAELEFICNRFLEVVTTNFGERLTSDEWNTGKMFFAGDAQRIGLINGIKTRAEVIQRIQELSLQNSQNPNNMLGFNKMKTLTALSGKKPEDVTAAHVEAINNEIVEEKIPGITAVLDTELAVAQTAVTDVSAALTTINAALGEGNHKATLAEGITALVAANTASAQLAVTAGTDRDKYQKLAKEFGAQISDEPTGGVKEGAEEIPDAPSAVAKVSYYSDADAELDALLAKQTPLPTHKK